MKEHLKTNSSTINKLQIFIGVVGLLIGTLVYLIDRPPDQTYFIYKNSLDLSLYKIFPNLFGSIGNNLPAFIHVFSFILITAGLIACQKRGYLIICASWFIVDSAFELGQKFKPLALKIVSASFAGIPFLENTENFFLHGTFDFSDLVFILLGTVMAYLVILTTNRPKKEGLL